MESATRIAAARGLKYVEDELAAGREVVFRKPETIDLIKKSSLYEYVDLPDGSVKVIKVNQDAKDIFEGKAPSSSTPPSLPAKPGKASKSARSFSDVAKEYDDSFSNEKPLSPEAAKEVEKISKLQMRPALREAIDSNRRAINAGREGRGLNPEMTQEQRADAATMRDPMVANTEGRSDPRSLRRAPRVVRIGGKEIELPEDYAERKKFRKYRLEEMANIGAARRRRKVEDRKTVEQLRGTLGRAGREAGLAVGGALNKLPKVPMPTARNPLVRFGLRYGKNIGGVRGGLAGIGALAGGALIGKMIQGSGELRQAEERDQEMLRRRARQDMLDLLGRKEQKQAVQMSINQNLAKLQMEAPDLYMRAATGRVLPQGAVVIGGAPRADLLNQLGMAMANGQFGQ